MNGILLIAKPKGITSHDVVDRVRRITGERTVGHAGTLDPLAEGLLIILIGRDATRRQAEFMAGEKEYVATVHLGAVSDTDDAEGTIEMTKPKAQIPNEIQINATLKRFTGEIQQVPPTYSAIKLKGRKAYELAREGTTPVIEPRTVEIKEIELLEYAYPLLRIRVVCGKGTYIRSLARDIGRTLGCGAYLTALTRTRSGAFHLDDAVSLDALTPENWISFILPLPAHGQMKE